MTTESFLRVELLGANKFHRRQAEGIATGLRRRMEMPQPELSLGPAWPAPAGFPAAAKSSSSESDGSSSRKKRKHYAGGGWEEAEGHRQQPPASHAAASLELQLSDPLPLDWEQCLDLQSGRMYYLNRKTLKRSWARPRELSVNLDLNISTAVADEDEPMTRKPAAAEAESFGGNMVAVPCAKCHLLVMLCKSSPSCPNCKFVQPLAPGMPQQAAAAHRRLDAVNKPLETLSLLH